jgi:catechol 2,3-dioxygenase-like lactoylglutathione lyase family enzyme
MEQRLSLVTLGVADLDRARRFYEDGLGWKRGNDNPSVAFYQLPGMILALWSAAALAEDAGVPAARSGFSGLSLAINQRSPAEVDAVLREAEATGGRVLKPGQQTFWGGYSGYFADPDGHLWEVAHNPFWSLDAEGRISLAG